MVPSEQVDLQAGRRVLLKCMAGGMTISMTGCVQTPKEKSPSVPREPRSDSNQPKMNGEIMEFEELLGDHPDLFLAPKNDEFDTLAYLERNRRIGDQDKSLTPKFDLWSGILDYEDADYHINIGGSVKAIAIKPKSGVDVMKRVEENASKEVDEQEEIYVVPIDRAENINREITELGGMPVAAINREHNAGKQVNKIIELYNEGHTIKTNYPLVWDAAKQREKFDRIVIDYGKVQDYISKDVDEATAEIAGWNYRGDNSLKYKFAVMPNGDVRTNIYENNPETIDTFLNT